MRIIYTGRQTGLKPSQQKKLDDRLAKLGRVIDRKGEKEAHVFLSSERRMHRAEVTVNYYGHQVAGVESAGDEFPAITGAIDKLEKQLLKLKAKFRERRRDGRAAAAKPEPESLPASVEPDTGPKVHRVNHFASYKPLTLEEAVLKMESDRRYVVYRDAETDRTAVLLRRGDGDFDLIEA